MVVHVFNSSNGEAGTGRSLRDLGHPDVHGKFQTSQGYRVRPCLIKGGREGGEGGRGRKKEEGRKKGKERKEGRKELNCTIIKCEGIIILNF